MRKPYLKPDQTDFQRKHGLFRPEERVIADGAPIEVMTAFRIEDNPDLMKVLLAHAAKTPICRAIQEAGGREVFGVLAKLAEELQSLLDHVANDRHTALYYHQFSVMLGSYRHLGLNLPMLEYFTKFTDLSVDPLFLQLLSLHVIERSVGPSDELKFACIHTGSGGIQLRTELDFYLETTCDKKIEPSYNTNPRWFMDSLSEALEDLDLLMVPHEVYTAYSIAQFDVDHAATVINERPAASALKVIAARMSRCLKLSRTIIVIDDIYHGQGWPMIARRCYEQAQTEV